MARYENSINNKALEKFKEEIESRNKGEQEDRIITINIEIDIKVINGMNCLSPKWNLIVQNPTILCFHQSNIQFSFIIIFQTFQLEII